MGQILTWRNETSVPLHFWETAQSRMINGSSGARYKPFLREDDVLYAFLSDICRFGSPSPGGGICPICPQG